MRRGLAVLLALAVVGTAWLLLGRRDADRAGRAGTPADASLEYPKLPAKEKPGAAAKGAGLGVEAPAPATAATAPLRVRVVGTDGVAVAGATVEAYEAPFSWHTRLPHRPPAAATSTGRDGTAVLAVARGRPYVIRASRGDAASVPTPAVADGAETTLVLEPSRALRCVVLLPEGAPARGHFVGLTFAHAGHAVCCDGTTDDAGVFEIPAFPEAWLDRLTAVVTRPGQDPAKPPVPDQWEFEFGRDELRGGVITLRLTVVRLYARVVNEGGVPVPHAMVEWARPSAPEAPSFRCVAVTDDDGRFDIALQRVQGEAFVIRADEHAPLVWRPEAPPADRKMHVPEIVLPRGLPLAGRVTDPRGNPIGGALVRLESMNLPGQVVDQAATGEDGRFRFAVVGEHVLYAFRPVDPDLCLPQLRVCGLRGGPDEVSVVLPEPIYGTVRFVAQGTGDAVQVEHLTLIVKDARGTEVAKRTWEAGLVLGQVRFEAWEEGTYAIEVYTARQEPARVAGVNIVRGRGAEVSVPLVPRR